jgi:diguanylate cyclase (GGDEF)-like protein
MSTDNLPTVLVVDDDRINRAALAELLRGECRLILAKDGPSALQRVAEDKTISLILLDVSMPGMNGYEVLQVLRGEPRTADISVIFITGHSEEKDEERGLLLGANDYIPKPLRPAIVRVRVRNHLKLAMQRRELEKLSQQDGLTGIANRRHFDEAFDRAYRSAVRKDEYLSLAMIDVDHFKQYNDHYGHGAGDNALRAVALALRGSAKRPYDVAARYGGEEFVLLRADTIAFDSVLEQLRQNIQALEIPHAKSNTASVLTISCGGVFGKMSTSIGPEEVLRRADSMLYQAKRTGRNRAVVEQLNVDPACSDPA